jgi:HD-GYP domain-containing protein (c-di-GMP phosphodiesterase class II)
MQRGRPYRPKKASPAEALQELSDGAGRQFDVQVVEALGRVVGDANGHASP